MQINPYTDGGGKLDVNLFDGIDRIRNRNDGIDQQEALGEEMEVDSDVNEDDNRERQLDDSFEDWYRNVGYWVQQKEELTQVPKANVFEVASEMDAVLKNPKITDNDETDR